MHQGFRIGLTAAALVAGLVGVSSAAFADEAWLEKLEPRVLKLADFSGDQNAIFGRAMTKWENSITEFTKGKITFENYWSASLLGAVNTLEGVGDGVADIGLVIPSYYPKQLPVGNWLFGFGSAITGSTLHDVAAGGAATMENAFTFKPLMDEYESHNIRMLHGTSTAPYNLLCRVPIESIADAKGKRVRVSGAMWAEQIAPLEMVSVSVAFNESYEALQRGVIDCIGQNPYQLAIGMVFKDVAPELVPLTLAQMQSSSWVINLDTWNSLPAELQDFIVDQNIIAATNIWKSYLEAEALVADLIETGKVRVNNVSQTEPIVQKQREETLANMAKIAPATVTDPQAVIDGHMARIAHWTKLLVDGGYPIADRDPAAITKAYVALRSADLSNFIAAFTAEATPVIKGE